MKSIRVSELSKICATRRRGQEASSRLEPYLKSGMVDSDLDDVEVRYFYVFYIYLFLYYLGVLYGRLYCYVIVSFL